MKKFWFGIFSLLLLTGCYVSDDGTPVRDGRLPSEDLEVLTKYVDVIAVLKDPMISCNSKEKYQAAKKLIDKVDMTFTRETKTINELLYYGDALYDDVNSETRNITFNYQYGDHYVRFIFHTYRNFVLRVDVQEK